MEPRGRRTLTVAFLFVLGTFATPIHLMVEIHEASHHERTEPEDHEHSHHESHPASDHELLQVSTAGRPAPVLLELVAVMVETPAPQIQTWSPAVEAEANSPPSSPESPPRSPRAPPL